MFIDTNIPLSLSLSLTESDEEGARGLRREGGTPGFRIKKSAISGKFEIRSRVPGITVVRSEFWIARLKVG